MRTWLKYGLWVAGVYTLLNLLALLINYYPLSTILWLTSPGFWLLELYKKVMGTGFRIPGGLEFSLYTILSIFIYFILGALIGHIFGEDKKTKLKKLFGWILIVGGFIVIISEVFVCRHVCMGELCQTIWNPSCVVVFTIAGLILAGIGGIIIWKQRKQNPLKEQSKFQSISNQ